MWGCWLRNVSAALTPAGPLPVGMQPGATTLLEYHFGTSHMPLVSELSQLLRVPTGPPWHGLRDEHCLVWEHLRMEPHDDPEARIRALEQPLSDVARASELGTTPYTSGDAYLPPPLPPPGPGPSYGAQYTAPGYGAPWAQPPRKSSGGIPWIVLGIGAVIFMILVA